MPVAAQAELDRFREVLRACGLRPPRRRCGSSTSGEQLEPMLRRSGRAQPAGSRSRAARAAGGRGSRRAGVRHRAHARPAELDLGPRRAPLLDGLPRALDRPLGQGRRVGRRARDHAADGMFLGHGDRRRRPDRGGAPAVLRRAHAGSAGSPSRCATTDAQAVARTATGTRSSRASSPPEARAHFRTETTYADRADDGTVVATPGTSEGVDALLAGLFAPGEPRTIAAHGDIPNSTTPRCSSSTCALLVPMPGPAQPDPRDTSGSVIGGPALLGVSSVARGRERVGRSRPPREHHRSTPSSRTR